jgi:NF-kappa-B inhibitor-like protein 2
VRDNLGWTPLHEAANHNFPDIVEALIDAGANVNDRGGPECQGVTPLIDAAQGGFVESMEVLLRRGANALAKSNDVSATFVLFVK